MTQMTEAKKGNITPEMKEVAEFERKLAVLERD